MSGVDKESMGKYIYCLFWFKSMSLQSTEKILPLFYFIIYFYFILNYRS